MSGFNNNSENIIMINYRILLDYLKYIDNYYSFFDNISKNRVIMTDTYLNLEGYKQLSSYKIDYPIKINTVLIIYNNKKYKEIRYI